MSHQNAHGVPGTNTIHACNKQEFNSHTETTTSLEVSDSLPSPSLPEDLIVEILSRLPVKSLLQFRCVCKFWKSLIFDPQLVKKHLHRSISDTHFTYHRLLSFCQSDRLTIRRSPCSVKSLFKNPSNPVVDSSSMLEPIHNFVIVGSCNGLLCCMGYVAGITFHLYNPCTGLKSKKSPIVYNHCMEIPPMVVGFGYDDQSDKYKLVTLHVSSINGTDQAQVYTFGEDDSWRRIQAYAPKLILQSWSSSTFLSGTLNWLVKPSNESLIPERDMILSFDLGKETFGEVLLPVDKVSYNYSILLSNIGVLRDCLFFSDENTERTHFIVWLMKEYGVKESWTKLYTISYMDFGLTNRLKFLVPLFMSENGEALLQIWVREFALFNPKENTFKYFESRDYVFYDATSYVESLVSPCY